MSNWRDKWKKHKIMSASSKIRHRLPGTRRMNRNNFFTLLRRYRHLIIKPINGTGGAGVIQVTSVGNGMYNVQHEKRLRKTQHNELYAAVKRATKKRHLKNRLVQQRIPLARIKGRPFDVRVIVQRKNGTGWIVTGMMAKKAGLGYFITNLSQGKGSGLPLSTAIRLSNIRYTSARLIRQRLRQTALSAVRQLQKHYRLRIVGFDMGIDPSGNVWIIEANFRPDITSFRWLRDKSIYHRIVYYSKHR